MIVIKSIFKRNITKKQAKDAGMAFVLIFIIIGFVVNDIRLFRISTSGFIINKMWPFNIAVSGLVINMIWSGFFTPFAWLWFGLAELLGNVSSRIILTVVFFFVITPVGFLRKILGKDRLKLKLFKKDKSSVLIHRDHTFIKENIEQPF